MPPQDTEQSRWFAEHVEPHVPMLRAWLVSRFPAGCDLEDVLQEAILRVLQAREKQTLTAPKAFLFAVARNLALDRIRQRQFTGGPTVVQLDALELVDEGESIPETVARGQELELLTAAIQALPERCRRIFTLRKVYGLSQHDIAQKLGLSEHTVSAQLTIGVHKCTDYLRRYRKEAGA
jgi:RNA polymerase sigma factor (sigma-70 family)